MTTRSASVASFLALTPRERRPRGVSVGVYNQLPGSASQAAYATDGSLWVLSTAPAGADKFIYHYVSGTWTNVPGLASRIAVAPDGSLYAVNAAGGLYHFANGSWSALGGASSDVAVDVKGNVYVTSLGKPGTDTAIYKNVGGAWGRQPGAASRLASAPSEYLYAITAAGDLYQSSLIATYFVACPGRVSRVVPLASGTLVALGAPVDPVNGAPIYGFTPGTDCTAGTFARLPGAGVDVSSTGSQIAVLGASGGIYATSIVSATATPTPGPITASWVGLNGYVASSPPYPGPFPQTANYGPTVVFTAIGQTVRVTIDQPTASNPIPTIVDAACRSIFLSNGVQGRTRGSVDVSLMSSTVGAGPCGLSMTASYVDLPFGAIGISVVGP